MASTPRHHAALHLFLLLYLATTTTHSLPPPPPTTTTYSTISYSFPSFDENINGSNFTKSPNSTIASGALQITPDTINNASFFLVHTSGRILLNRPFTLYEQNPKTNTTHVASFNTTFDINVSQINNTTAGEGLAFLIAPNTSDPPPGSEDGYLGLTNSTLDGNPENHIVAVEFDTEQETQLRDPNSNHVGLDINSVVSTTTVDLTLYGIEIAPNHTAFWTVWIDYDGSRGYISVYMNATGNPKPLTPIINASLDLSAHLKQSSYFGFAASTGSNYQLNCIRAWNLTVEYIPSGGGGGWPWWKYALAVALPLVVAVVVIGVVVNSCMKRKVGVDTSMMETLKALPGMPKEFTFKELKKATNNFDERLKLGQGGFGVVYKGVIAEENMEVAVKMFSRGGVSSQDDFLQELTIINRLRHKHLVRLIGWCHKNGVLLLVYEYMPNGSLDQHLFSGSDRPILRWQRRYNVISGLVSALHYLHDEYDQMVVHRDLKASNVMLDAFFNARLGDFGLARALDTGKTSYAEVELGGMPGTLGYIAPECFHTGKATRQSDVFGFGAVVLEVVCGRRPRSEVDGFHYLSDWVWKLYREGRILEAVDARLEGDFVADEAERLLKLGLSCNHPIPNERPKMQGIVQILSGTVGPPQLPPFKPAFVWQSVPEEEEEAGLLTGRNELTSTVVGSSYDVSTGWSPLSVSYKEGLVDGEEISESKVYKKVYFDVDV